MVQNDADICAILESTTPALRSQLYHLKPIGIGTPLVECMTSYVRRLSQAHNVHTEALIVNEILPQVGKAYIKRPLTNGVNSRFWSEQAMKLNGLSGWARDWKNAIGRLTSNEQLCYLTMHPWTNVLSPKKLLRPTLAWCSECYRQWYSLGQPIYQPLLWMLQVVSICPLHMNHLQTVCSSCKRVQPVLTKQTNPLICKWCNHRLDVPTDDVREQKLNPEQIGMSIWIANVVGDMLNVVSSIEIMPSKEVFMRGLEFLVQKISSGNLWKFTHQNHIRYLTFKDWLEGKTIPEFPNFLKMCCYIQIHPLSIFGMNNYADIYISNLSLDVKVQESIRTRAKKPFNIQRSGSYLMTALTSNQLPPPSVREVARRVGCENKYLWKYHNQLCLAIAEKRKSYLSYVREQKLQDGRNKVKQVTQALLDQGVYPSLGKVRTILMGQVTLSYQLFHQAWIDALAERGYACLGRGYRVIKINSADESTS